MGDVFRQQSVRDGVATQSKKWYGSYKDEHGKRHRVPLSSDKQAARSMLRDIERDVERRRAGFVDPFAESRNAPIDGLIVQYLKHMRLEGDSQGHIADTKRLLNLVVKACGFDTLAKLEPSKLDDYLEALVKPDGTPTSARTKNTHRQSIMGFTNWCVRKNKLQFNPLARSAKAKGDTVIKRRALPLEQLKSLLDVARERPLREKLMVRRGPNKGKLVAKVGPATRDKLERQGKLRVLLYRMAFYTGLRRNELRSMQVCHLLLKRADPKAALPGSITKNKQAANLPLRPDLASDLREWIESEGLAASDKVFPVGRDVAKHLKRDMRAAGIPVVDDRGRIFDFHALRKCTATYLNKSGVPITTAKEMLRHSTVELTAGVYNDGDLHDLRGAVEHLPTL